MLKKIFMFLTMLLGSSMAMAENLFDPVAGDQSLKMLNAMFGNLKIFGEAGSDTFADSVLIFNGGVLILGGVLVVYSLLVGTIGTAHDGEMMGKKYSSVWVPLRTVLGTALVLPIVGGGSYCLMQLIVGWLIVQGVGLADKVWGAYMTEKNLVQAATVGVRAKEASDVVWKVFESSVCMRGLEKIYNNNKTNSPLTMSATFGVNKVTATKEMSWSYGLKDGNVGMFTSDTCGKVNLSTEAAFSQINAFDNAYSEQAGVIPEMSKTEMKQAIENAKRVAEKATSTMLASADSLANAYVSNPQMSEAEISTNINGFLASYNSSLREAAGIVLNKAFNFTNMGENATKDGWFLAGAWFLKMSNIMDVAGNIMNMYPTASGGRLSNGVPGSIESDYYNKFQQNYGAALAQIKLSSGVLGVAEGRIDGSADSWGSVLKDAMPFNGVPMDEVMVKAFKKTVSTFVIQKDEHPIMVMKGLGEWLFHIGNSLLFLVNQYGDDYPSLKMIVMTILPFCYALGFTLSFVMPMMPFMIWLGCLMAWIILCVEAMVAAPMWAIMHLTMNGDDMVGTGAQGYKLVLSLMLRPVLMIFGFIAAISIIQVFGQFINTVFTDVYLLSQQNWGLSTIIFGMLAFPALYLGCMWVLIVKCMSIVHQIPDQLLQWFGGGGSQLGNIGEQFGGLDSTGFRATRAVADTSGKFGENFMKVKDMNIQKEQNRLLQANSQKEAQGKQSEAMNSMAGSGAGDVLSKLNDDTSNSDSFSGAKKDQNGQFVATKDKEKFEQKSGENKKAMMSVSSAISANPNKSSAMKAFNKDVLNDLNNGQTYNSAVNNSFEKAFDAENGDGAFKFTLQSSGLDSDVKPTDALKDSKFRNNAESINLMSEKLQNAGVDSKDFMSNAISDLNKDSNLGKNQKIVDLDGRVEKEVKANGGSSGLKRDFGFTPPSNSPKKE